MTITSRQAQAADANQMAACLLAQAGQSAYSALWLAQHASNSFVCVDDESKVIGTLISWKSPVAYNTVVIDAIGVQQDQQDYAHAVVQSLLGAAFAEFQCRCLRKVLLSATAAAVMEDHFWQLQGFDADKEMEGCYRKTLAPLRICLHGKKMRPNLNTGGGQVNEQTTFEYQQDGDIVWGTYSGGEVKRGVLVGKMNASRDMSISYMQIDEEGKFYQGTSKSSTEYLNDGRLVLYEDWIWTGGDRKGEGNAIIEEIKE